MNKLKIYGFTENYQGFMEINDDLESMKNFVNGWIERIRITSELDLIVNEEGAINDSDARVAYYEDDQLLAIYYGNCFVCRHDKNNFISIKDSDKEWINKHLIHIYMMI